MKPRSIVILVMILFFGIVTYFALMREITREEAIQINSISGVAELGAEVMASGRGDVRRSDRLALLLLEPETGEVAAMRFISPLTPPMNIMIGQQNAAGGKTLEGAYLLVGITDKDGEVLKVTPGELYGISPQPIPLGAIEVRLKLNQLFQGGLFNRPAQ